MTNQKILIFITAFLLKSICFATPVAAWTITKDHWSNEDEKNYSKFVQSIGLSACDSVDSCLKSSANYLKGNDPDYTWKSDCGKLPYVLRIYFAWKNNLPFSYVSEISIIQQADGTIEKDDRYSTLGDVVKNRYDIVQNSTNPINFFQELEKISDTVSSGMQRANTVDTNLNLLPDFYPVELTRNGIKPGTNIYDPDGHVAIVYEITPDGRILYIDAHPDQSLTRGSYSNKFSRSSVEVGAGFKNFRPLQLSNYSKDISLNLIGGHIGLANNESLSDYSLMQFLGTQKLNTNWKSAEFIINKESVNYYEYLRKVLFSTDVVAKINPLDEVKEIISDLCSSVKERVNSTDLALQAGISNQQHPDNLPSNIFAADGDWEKHSTCSRDSRLKISFLDLKNRTIDLISRVRNHDSFMSYDGRIEIKKAMKKSIQSMLKSCSVNYKNSNGDDQNIDLMDVMNRIYNLSYDPYDYPEHRWGATNSRELRSCKDDSNKTEWYNAQQILRNEINRHPDWKMGYSLNQLQSLTDKDLNIQKPVSLDVLEAIDNMN